MTQVDPKYEGLAANDPAVDRVMAFAVRYWIVIAAIGVLFAVALMFWMLSL